MIDHGQRCASATAPRIKQLFKMSQLKSVLEIRFFGIRYCP
jgi:hypothetical protein